MSNADGWSTFPSVEYVGDRWRYRRTDEDCPRELVRSELHRRGVSVRDRLPPRRAAAKVWQSVFGERQLEWFVLRENDSPRPVGESDVWRIGYESGAVQLAKRRNEDASLRAVGLVIISPSAGCIDRDEAEARGMTCDPDHDNGPYLTDQEWNDLPELKAIIGITGLADWVKSCWIDVPISTDKLDAGNLGGVAILAADALSLFGIGAPRALTIAVATDDSNLSDTARVDKLWPHQKGAKWSAEEKAEILKMRAAGRSDKEIEKVTGAKRQAIASAVKGSRVAKLAEKNTAQRSGNVHRVK